MPPSTRLRILHISDLHHGQEEAKGSAWRMRRVLESKAWRENLQDIAQDGKPDLICFTGDLAFSGQASQYTALTQFLDDLLAQLGVDKQRLFVVPGNHDIDRHTHPAAWLALRNASWQTDADKLSRWLAGGAPPLGFQAEWREQILARQQAYRDWHATYWPERTARFSAQAARHGHHPHLGYHDQLDFAGQPVHIIGLDSAWLAGDEHDMGKLRLTDEQIARHLTHANQADGIKIVLLHHPISELADAKLARQLFDENGVHLVLHGHLHDPAHQRLSPAMQELSFVESAAGCLYEHDNFPNCLQLLDLAPNTGKVQQIWLRSWSKNGFWHSDSSHYAGSREGKLCFDVPKEEEQQDEQAPHELSNKAIFGRSVEMEKLRAAFAGGAASSGETVLICCAVEGMPGVGKTHLAMAFIAQHWAQARPVIESYVRLYLSPDSPLDSTALAQSIAAQLKLQVGGKQLVPALRQTLQERQLLLLIENMDSPPLAQAVAGLVNQLAGCHILITARYREVGKNANNPWRRVEVAALTPAAALDLLRAEAPDCPASDAQLAELAAQLGHLPLALHIAASHLAMGHKPSWFLAQIKQSFAIASADEADGPAAHLPQAEEKRARAILHSSFAISWQSWKELAQLSPTQRAGLAALAHGPVGGVGEALGAALTGLLAPEVISQEACEDYATLYIHAKRLSLISIEAGRVVFHPLMQAWLRQQTAPEQAHARWQAWLLARLPDSANDEQNTAWKQVQAEEPALAQWLSACSLPDALGLSAIASMYANQNGPYAAWQQFCLSTLPQLAADDLAHSSLYWILGNTVRRLGEYEQALQAAKDKYQFDTAHGREFEAALALGLQADIYYRRGQLDEALRIWREEELPVYAKLGKKREYAITMGKIADILYARDELDEALRIRREEELPVYAKLGEVGAYAITMSKIADILYRRGELDEALRIHREEELPVYAKLGDVRSYAVTMGKIADILYQRGELDEALRIRREEELPVYAKLGDIRALLVGQANLAITLMRRGSQDDLAEAEQLLKLALAAAQRLRLPEVVTIENLLKRFEN